ncbi:3-demethylubiquinone-9 3-methyltransferase [Candidatus Moduliflexus flocculans]|uniref:3-demethylubiquinone-9 3-methyltransferase n=1 Tax=Candidatus Moduliflexus flocculans TaxID=1499966 RepID=A0A0S6W3J8_9BACT|nr:3-demethylubiquinone-9 3-methyltransferase [Candidatus Moduliflexus flocculans]
MTRFAFGENWQKFLTTLTEAQIIAAETALKTMLSVESLAGKTMLDIGAGSGLHSLAARRLGARVVSFDFDAQAVACVNSLKQRFFPNDANWRIMQGSALDVDFMRAAGMFDLVYSWGVLHHTGEMWKAIELAAERVAPGGVLFLAIYNAHWTAPIWKQIKYCYNISPPLVRRLLIQLFSGLKFVGAWLTTGQSPLKTSRGMAFRTDVIDWLGGYPYEYASIDAIVRVVEAKGFQIHKVVPTAGWTGCNQFVFHR